MSAKIVAGVVTGVVLVATAAFVYITNRDVVEEPVVEESPVVEPGAEEPVV